MIREIAHIACQIMVGVCIACERPGEALDPVSDSGVSDGGSEEAGPLPFDAFCHLFREQWVALATECWGARREYLDGLMESSQRCVETPGTVYHPERAASCIAVLEAGGCAILDMQLPFGTCNSVVEGVIPEGQPCTNGSCAAGLFCDEGYLPVPGTRAAVPGECSRTCVRLSGDKGAGEPCNLDELDCVEGLYCGPVLRGLNTGSCVSAPGLGDDCGSAGFCLDGAFCDPDSNTCARLRKEGESCVDEFLFATVGNCEPGLKCSLGVCRRFVKRGEDCALSPCAPTLFCSNNLTCIEWPLLGEACRHDRHRNDCLTGYCDSATSRCEPEKPVGAVCESNFECTSTWCDSNTCVEVGCSH